MPRRDRLHRSELTVPGSNVRMLEKAPKSGADVVLLDLEDAVAPDAKEQARRNVIDALGSLDWSRCSVAVRINALDTRWCFRDVIEVVGEAGEHVDFLVVPKVGSAADLHFVAVLLAQVEAERGLAPLGLSALIETAAGLANVEEIASACPERLEALVFGVADYAASTRARTTVIGGASPDYAVLTDSRDGERRARHWGDQWHYPLSRILVACRAAELRAIDGPYGDVRDPAGYVAAARRAAALGYDGKWAIHPSQVGLANEVFTPTDSELAQARRILSALSEAADEGRGAIALDGRLVDAASIRMARQLVSRADQIQARAVAAR
ncbi:MAG TPA: CoA ester lyase [Gaiellaceae bacterium]|nr:CoA ester lyase [Gaiellaceae bacterium]